MRGSGAGRRGPRERAAPKEAVGAAAAPGADDEVDLTGLFAVSNRGVVRIDHDVPGNNRREQMVNATMLLAYAMERLQNRRLVPIVQIIATCKAHRCYDRNLVTALRKQKTPSQRFDHPCRCFRYT